ncbi:MAG TPA: hypothetical protein VGJ22_01365 [Anaerolineales bacterium]|jgi:hypothetical protein
MIHADSIQRVQLRGQVPPSGNTQAVNLISFRLYDWIGFTWTGETFPVLTNSAQED